MAVWRVELNREDIAMIVTCSLASGSLKGSSVCLSSLVMTSSSCWSSDTMEISSPSTGLRQATNVQYRDRSSTRTLRTADFSTSWRDLTALVTSNSPWSTLGSMWSPFEDFLFFFINLVWLSNFFFSSDRNFLYSLLWSLSRLCATFFQSSIFSWRGSTRQSSNALKFENFINWVRIGSSWRDNFSDSLRQLTFRIINFSPKVVLCLRLIQRFL